MPIVITEELIKKCAGKRAYLYGRISTAGQVDGVSLSSQRGEAHTFAAKLNLAVIGQDFEQGSGRAWDLAGIERVLHLAGRRAYDVLIVKDPSRLSRSRGKQAYIEHLLQQAQIQILYIDVEFDDSASGRLQRSIMADVAEFQLERTAELSIAGRYDKVEKLGRPVGNGQLPYGWCRVRDTEGLNKRTVGYEHHPDEAAVIRRFLDLRHLSTHQLCALLNDEGIPAPGKWGPTARRPRTGKWAQSSIRHILNNPMTWGEYRYGVHKVDKQDGRVRLVPHRPENIRRLQLPPILTQEEVAMILDAMQTRRVGGRRPRTDDASPVDPFVLRTLLRCGHCGSTLATTTGGKSKSYRLYRCLLTVKPYARRAGKTACTLPALIAVRSPKRGQADGIEDLIYRIVKDAVSDDAEIEASIRRAQEAGGSVAEHGERRAFLRSQIERKRRAHQDATRKWSEACETGDELDRDSFEATRQSLRREISALEQEVEQLEANPPRGMTSIDADYLRELVAAFRAAFDLTTPSERRQCYQLLQLQLTILSDPDGPYQIGKYRYRIEIDSFLDRNIEGSNLSITSESSAQVLLPFTAGSGSQRQRPRLELRSYGGGWRFEARAG